MGRYLKLDGTSPDIRTRTLRHIFTAESLTATALTLGTAAAAYGVADLRVAFIAAACGIASSAGAQAFTKKFTKGSLTFHFGDLDRRFFDRAPDNQTPPTRPSYRLAAEQLAARSTRTSAVITALALPHTVGLITLAALMPHLAAFAVASAALTGVLGLNMAANAGLMAWRFGKVAKTDWTILDRPPGNTTKVPKPAFSILPLPPGPMPA